MDQLLTYLIVVSDMPGFAQHVERFGSVEDFANLPFVNQLAVLAAFAAVHPEGIGTEIVLETEQDLTLSCTGAESLGCTQDPDFSPKWQVSND